MIQRVVVWLVGLTVTLAPGCVGAQGPMPPLPVDAQQQRILDLKDYREWLEAQLALAKALLNEARQALAQKEADLAACRTAPAPHP